MCEQKYRTNYLRGIIDPTEIRIQKPSDPNLARACWSEYKHYYTIKILIVLSPAGHIVYVSRAFPGRITDNDLVRKCGFLDLVEKGDVYAADKGVNIGSALALRGAILRTPPRKFTGQAQFSSDAEFETSRQANLRIHVERAIRSVKCFRYWQGDVQIALLRHAGRAMRVCVMLTNLQDQPFGPTLFDSQNIRPVIDST